MDPGAAFAVSFAGCAALAATMPLAAARAVPAIARGALALAIAPLAAEHASALATTPGLEIVSAVEAAALGAIFGGCASVIAGAVTSAGGLIDVAIAAPPTGVERVFGQSAGPFATLLPLLFAFGMCASGALTWLISGYIAAYGTLSVHYSPTPVGAAALGRTVFAAALTLALPVLGAQALATMLSGCAARMAPRINGMLLAPGLGSALSLVAALAGVPTLLFALIRLAHIAARAPHFG